MRHGSKDEAQRVCGAGGVCARVDAAYRSVVAWLVGHRNIGMLDAERVKAVLMAAGFVLLFGSFIAVVVYEIKAKPWDKS